MDTSFWGKIDKSTSMQLPLEAHLADVAAVMEELCCQPGFKGRIARSLGRPITESDIPRLCCLAALHDIGKVTPGFQNKSTGKRPVHGHIYPIPGLWAEQNLERLVGCMEWLEDWGEEDALINLLVAAFSHHGTPISDMPDIDRIRLWPQDDAAPEWKFLTSLGVLLKRWYPKAFVSNAARLPLFPLLEHYFAGMLMLADWLGSDLRFFPIQRDLEGRDYISYSRKQARIAVEAVGLASATVSEGITDLPEFITQFGFPPNALQQAVEQVPLSPEGGIAIMEAETGLGKTEAALRYFTRLRHAGLVDGLYFANPLRFAATQLFGRVCNFVRRTYPSAPPATVLAVPGYLRVDDASGVKLPDYSVLWDDDPGAEKAARRWAGEHPKRYLSAPVAVGTIDQALLAGLRTPHAHLRAAALSRSLLVIDEVHASDPYMTELTCAVLDLFRHVGGQVLLLSATLAGETRRRYLNTMGAKMAVPSFNECVSTPYPLISSCEKRIAVKEERKESDRKRPIKIFLQPIQDDVDALVGVVSEFADAVRQGGRILILRNSVATVVETLEALEEQNVFRAGPAEPGLHTVSGVSCPHHSRFAREDRELLDREVERVFGKPGTLEGGVLVATQTLEQSLDVDFDLLITDLCPMDVLLQRIGRLHRHRIRDTKRPKILQEPQCIVLVPEQQSATYLRSKSAKRNQYGKDRAYPNLVALMATWDYLEKLKDFGKALIVPEMCRELIESALHSEALDQVAKLHAMQEDFIRVLGSDGAMSSRGRYSVMRWDKHLSEQGWKRKDPNPKTRLGTADLSVEFDDPFQSPFGNTIRQMVLPEYLIPRDGWDQSPEVLETGPELTIFRLGSATYTYTRYGLRKEKAK